MSDHSDLMGGSSAAKRIHCPGSYQLESLVAKEEASDHAERGTALHEAMEDYLLNHDGEPMSCLVGKVYNKWTITHELVETKLEPALAAFSEVIQQAGGDMDFMIEVQASLDVVIPGAFGTIDILGKGADGRLWVLDWKFGDGVPVRPDNNYQCAFYGSAAMYDEDPEVKELVWGGDDERSLEIVFVIVQPRVGHPDEPDWFKWETNDMWVEQFLSLAVEAYDKMQQPDAPTAEGDWCRWCRANKPGICPQKGNNIVRLSSGHVEPGAMDPVTLAHWLEEADKAEVTIKNLRAFAHHEAERGLKVPGWKVVPKRASRAYNNKDEAEAALRKMPGVKVGDIMCS